MTKLNKQIKISASKQEVWNVIADLGGVYKFNPNVSKSYYTSEKDGGIGASRICELRPAGKVEEVAVKWDEGTGFTLRIDPLEKAPPLKNFIVSIDITQQTTDSVLVNFDGEYSMKLGVIGKILDSVVVKSQMEKAFQDILDGLKVHIETGAEITDAESLQNLLKVA